jgi:hypothetical protein
MSKHQLNSLYLRFGSAMRFIGILLISFVTLPVIAKTTHTIKTGNAYISIISASVQRILPGIPEAPIRYEYKFKIIWKSSDKPDSFLCYVDNTWRYCAVDKNANSIRKGETIELRPMETAPVPVHQKNFMPENNSIFFKTKKSGWLYITVKKITKKPDIALP